MQAILNGILDPCVIARSGATKQSDLKGHSECSEEPWRDCFAEFMLSTFATLSVDSANVLAMTCEGSDLPRETAERGGEKEGKKDDKPEKQMAGGGATRPLWWGLWRSHMRRLLRLVARPCSAHQRLVVGVDGDTCA